MEKNRATMPLSRAVNLVRWYEEKKEFFNVFSIKARWALAQNINQLKSAVTPFENFCNELKIDLQKKYFTDEKYYDKVGEELKIKDEYLPQFQNEVNDTNLKITELLNGDTEFSLVTIDFGAEFEAMDGNPDFTMDDIEKLLDLGNDVVL